MNISPDDIQRKIKPRTKAITVVHYNRYSWNMDAIMEIATERNLKIIEYATYSPGAEYRGKICGTNGDIGCFGFFLK